ncbi:MAG TPA: hypothetical protein VI197_10815 [Polyangiaceae bacterium]
MWFAILACVSGVLLVLGSWRLARAQPSAHALEACVRSLQQSAPVPVDAADRISVRVGQLVERIGRTRSRSVAVAELNEFISEVDSASGAEVPLTLARVCFTLGLLLGVLALATRLGAATGVGLEAATPALVAVMAGLASGMVCYQLGLSARRRRQEFRGVLRRLTQVLERRLPASDA